MNLKERAKQHEIRYSTLYRLVKIHRGLPKYLQELRLYMLFHRLT